MSRSGVWGGLKGAVKGLGGLIINSSQVHKADNGVSLCWPNR